MPGAGNAGKRQGENIIKRMIAQITPGLAPLHRKLSRKSGDISDKGLVLLLCASFSSGGIFNGPISLYFFIFILNMYLCKAPRYRQKKIIIMDTHPPALRERGGTRIVPPVSHSSRDEEGSRPRAGAQHLYRETPTAGVGPSPGGPMCLPLCPVRAARA